MTAKPIFTIGVPKFDYITDERRDNIGKKLSDYHVVVYPLPGDKIEFKVFYHKEFDDKNFEEMKEYILSELKKGVEA